LDAEAQGIRRTFELSDLARFPKYRDRHDISGGLNLRIVGVPILRRSSPCG